MTFHEQIELERLAERGPQELWDGRTKEGRAQKSLVNKGLAQWATGGTRITITDAGRAALVETSGTP